MPLKYESMQERLIANSVMSETHFWNGTPCWEWIGKYVYSNRGLAYGRLNVRIKSGKNKGKIRTERAHRVALRVFKGRYLGKRYVGGHYCNISWCINPEHLAGGTQRTNVRKTVNEGRHRNQYNRDVPLDIFGDKGGHNFEDWRGMTELREYANAVL